MLTQDHILQARYRIDGLLGRGGMGAVYRAWDTRLSIPVAIKEMQAQSGLDADMLTDLRKQFQQEATVLARLSHPNLVGVTDYFQEGRNVYLVMKYVDGEGLDDRIRRQGPIPEAQALAWSSQLLDAIAYCHSQGVIHRDIKPQNIIIDSAGDAILVDFGLVKLWDPSDPSTRTAVRGLGTPQYAPPEQYEVQTGHTEPCSDLYSFGATLYHALTGQAPPTATMRVAAPEDFVPIRSLLPAVSDTTADAVERAMALARSRRWSSAWEMAQALGIAIRPWDRGADRTEVLSTDAPTTALSGGLPAAKTPTRRRFPVWALAVGAALLFTGTFAVAALEFAGVLHLGIAAMLRPDRGEATPTPAPTAETDVVPKSTVALVSNVTLPTDTPAPTATFRPTPTPRPSSTPRPTATPRPSPTSTAEGETSPTPTPTPTASPEPTADATTTATSTPSATPEPVSGPTGALVDFETFGTWRRGDQAYGDLTQTSEQAKGGAYAAQLDYDFPASGDDYVVFNQTHAIGGTPNSFAAWVYGDGSGHFLNLWVEDAQGEIWSVALGTIGAAGWRQMNGQLVPGLPWPAGPISGPDNGAVDYPVTFTSLVLDRPGTGPQQGTIYIDELTAWSGDVAVPTAAPTTATGVAATPLATSAPSGVGRILLTVQTSDGAYLYTTDPGWNQMAEVGRVEAGSSTCNVGLTTVATLAGQSYNVARYGRCAVTERTDACTSPDGAYKLITNFLPGWEYAVLLRNVADGTETFIYQGKLATAAGVQWAPTSRYVSLGIGSSIQVVPVATQQLQQAIATYDDSWLPQFSPDGTKLLYLKPSGGLGNADVFVVDVNGANERNLTNVPGTAKLCPVWRR